MFSPDPKDVVKRFKEYDFEKDDNFRDGLAEILPGVEEQTQEEKDETINRAKAFYFSKITGTTISWDDINSRTPYAEPTDTVILPDTSRPLTFTEISELIQSGQTHLIPNNKEIPVGTNAEMPSDSKVKEIPRKPWEK